MLKEYTGELLLTPCPTVLVTVKHEDVENVLTVSWTGIASSHPEYVTIAINPKRFSHRLIADSGKFCIGIPGFELLDAVDFCGSYSGRDVDKFAACGFTKKRIADYVLIEQCKFHVLCDVVKVIELGSHHLFVAKVVSKYLDAEVGDSLHQALEPIAYFRPFYYRLAQSHSGFYGYTRKQREESAEKDGELSAQPTKKEDTV